MSESIEDLYARAGPLVLRRCRQMLGSDEAALDATQWVFLRALETGFVPQSPAESLTWLYTTATRHCLTVLRTGRRRFDLRARHHDTLSRVVQSCEGQTVSRDLLRRALGRLDDRSAEIALLTFVQGLSVRRAAETCPQDRRRPG